MVLEDGKWVVIKNMFCFLSVLLRSSVNHITNNKEDLVDNVRDMKHLNREALLEGLELASSLVTGNQERSGC